MRYIIKIYIQGVLKTQTETTDDYDWKWLSKNYDGAISEYHKQGYKSIYGSTQSDGYMVMFNEEKRLSITISRTMETISDFKDAEGNNIICEKIYLSKKLLPGEREEDIEYDHYTLNINCSCFGDTKGVYLRNIYRFNRHNNYLQSTMRDIEGDKLTQEYIDSLNLVPKK